MVTTSSKQLLFLSALLGIIDHLFCCDIISSGFPLSIIVHFNEFRRFCDEKETKVTHWTKSNPMKYNFNANSVSHDMNIS